MGAEIAKLLQLYGGRGISTLLMSTIWYLYRANDRMRLSKEDDLKDQNEKLLELIEQRIGTDLKHEQAFSNLTKIINVLVDRL